MEEHQSVIAPLYLTYKETGSVLRLSVSMVRKLVREGKLRKVKFVRIPTMPITHSDLMAITIPSDADHRRSEATLGCSYHAGVIGIRQSFCC
jgi:hypothetical protein